MYWLSLQWSRSPPTEVRPRFGEPCEIRRFHLLDVKSAIREKSGGVPRKAQAFKHPVMDGRPSLLPPSYPRIGRERVLKEDELALRLQDSPDAAKGLQNVRYCTQREGADHRVDRAISQRDPFPRKVQELYVEDRSAATPLCEPNHRGVQLEGIEPDHFRRIVIRKVRAGSNADFKDYASRRRENALTDFPDRPWIPETVDEIRVDVISVRAHQSLFPP